MTDATEASEHGLIANIKKFNHPDDEAIIKLIKGFNIRIFPRVAISDKKTLHVVWDNGATRLSLESHDTGMIRFTAFMKRDHMPVSHIVSVMKPDEVKRVIGAMFGICLAGNQDSERGIVAETPFFDFTFPCSH